MLSSLGDGLPPGFNKLPLFATDAEISIAIVGKTRSEKWRKERLPTLASKTGFPAVDAFHGGRSIHLVWRFYQHYLGVTSGRVSRPDGVENPAAFRPGRGEEPTQRELAMTPIRQVAEMPPRDYSDHLEHWMEPPEKPRDTTALIAAYVALAVAVLGMAAAFLNLAFKFQAGE